MRTSLLLLLLALTSGSARAQRVGTPWEGQRAVVESTGAIMQRMKTAPPPPAFEAPEHPSLSWHPLDRPPRALVKEPKLASIEAEPVRDTRVQSIGLNFDGASASDTASTHPPDTMGAVGPT